MTLAHSATSGARVHREGSLRGAFRRRLLIVRLETTTLETQAMHQEDTMPVHPELTTALLADHARDLRTRPDRRRMLPRRARRRA
jgi:hypothetical protein